MADQTYKRAQDIVKGDVVKTDKVIVDGKVVDTATVRCVLMTLCKNNEAELCLIPSSSSITPLMITPYHPIATGQDPRAFSFPIDHTTPTKVGCKAVYSFLLEESDAGKTMIIQDVNVIVLGSNLISGIANHPFFSPYTTISTALQCFKGWASGFIVCNSNLMLRDAQTNLVNGFDYTKEFC
jgi:hypothetical protein